MRRLLLVLACLGLFAPSPSAQPQAQDGVAALLGRLEQVLRAGDGNAYLALLGQTADRVRAARFAAENLSARVGRVAIRERDRAPLEGVLPGDGYQLLVEILFESGARARLVTWRLDVRRRGGLPTGAPDEWGIVDQQAVSSLAGLYRLSLNTAKQYSARDLVVKAEDFEMTLESGSVFVADADGNTTALVLIGRGEMTFSPTSKVERGQVRLMSGAEVLSTPYDVAFLRLHPFDLDQHINRSALTERPVDPREVKRAEEIFRDEAVKTFSLDLGDLSTDNWSLLPNGGDFIAEVHTRRFDTLTYARSSMEIEDISIFDRKNRHNIALYQSEEHVRLYGRFYSDDDRADYAVSRYDIDVSFDPSRQTLAGRTRMAVEVRSKTGLSSLPVRLASSLNVRSVFASEFGRLLFVRIRNQNSIVVNLPATATAGYRFNLTIEYDGRLEPQPIDREGVSLGQEPQIVDESDFRMEESYLYSNRSFWYPQSPTSSYSSASIRITVPRDFACAASGEPVSTTPVPPVRQGGPPAQQYAFQTTQPARYLAFLVTHLVDLRSDRVRLGSVLEPLRAERPPGVFYDDVDLLTRVNPRLKGRGRDLSRTAQDIIRFYASLIGDCPYPTVTLALVERSLPGGHSPAYLAVVSQPSPGSRLRPGDDPASFPEFPEFFLAHELAHQWWGQAVGWKNYHEQWLSEGFAQYFAALYAERVRGRQVFDGVLRRMLRWTLEESDQGPVYLGYRIGHVKNDSRLFRAVVYNKGAVALHTLRMLVGDKAFFAGIRRFYERWRFSKAGSDDLRQALEAEARVPLARFFEQWIYGQDLPRVTFTWKVEQDGEGQVAVLRFEQAGDPFEVPVTVLLDYFDKPAARIFVRLSDRVVETRVPLVGALRRAEISRDETAALVR